MGVTERMGIKEIRAALGQRIDAAFYLGEVTVLTKNNQDRAVIAPIKVMTELEELRAEVKALRAQVKAAK
jgi:cell division protein FtsB